MSLPGDKATPCPERLSQESRAMLSPFPDTFPENSKRLLKCRRQSTVLSTFFTLARISLWLSGSQPLSPHREGR
ncbi:MAG: hypothetical protein KDI64_04700, partial [Candidatus Accumulibacter sp.]|nr:hypothetical protein [Accumulibacter sp.]